MTALPALLPDLVDLGTRAADFARAARSPATERAYRSDWADFSQWCEATGLAALPAAPPTIGAYLTDRAGVLKVATLERRIAAITVAHRLAGHGFDSSHPAIARVLAGIRRTLGTRQERKTALLTEDLRKVVKALPPTVNGIRDRAVLLIGFAGAFRRSELTALDLDDIKVTTAGVVLVIRRSKTDQEGAGREIGIPRSRRSATCPVAALEAWLGLADGKKENGLDEDFSRDRTGNNSVWTADRSATQPVFRTIDHGKITNSRLSGQAVAKIVKRAVARVGLDPVLFAGHSLRSGFATSAARGGADLAAIMQQTGHKNSDVAMRYIQSGKLLQNPASKAVRL